MRVIGYIILGYPNVEKSVESAKHYVDGGCDMLELSIPLYNNTEKPYLSDAMKKAVSLCDDNEVYLEAIREIVKQNPNTDITLLTYDETIEAIGEEKFVDFCVECKIKDVNSASLKNEKAISLFNENGIRIAGLVNFMLDEWRIEEAAKATGFIYCQAFKREGQQLKDDLDSIDKIIPYLRGRGVKNDIYCGGGIAKPSDAKIIKDAGADGFFLGTSLLDLYDEPEKLKTLIKEFCDAVK